MHSILNVLSAKIVAGVSSTTLLWLAFSAFFMQQPEKLPARWRDWPQFLYTWQRNATLAFINARHSSGSTVTTAPPAATVVTDPNVSPQKEK